MNYNEQNGFDGEKKTPWYLQADEPAPKDYNPYEDTPSVFEEIYEENKQNLGGVKQHEWDTTGLSAGISLLTRQEALCLLSIIVTQDKIR